MEYSQAQSLFDTAVGQYEKGQFGSALTYLTRAKQATTDDRLIRRIKAYIAKCLNELKPRR